MYAKCLGIADLNFNNVNNIRSDINMYRMNIYSVFLFLNIIKIERIFSFKKAMLTQLYMLQALFVYVNLIFLEKN